MSGDLYEQSWSGPSDVVRHLVEQAPETNRDASGVLCVRAGEAKARMIPEGEPWKVIHGWTQDRDKVTCKRCLEWMHA